MNDTLKRAVAMLLSEANAIEDCHTRGDGDWTGEDDAKASHDAMREVAVLLGEEAERMAEQTFFLKAAQAESERYCEQRDNMLHDIRRALDAWDSSVLEKPRDGRLQESMECLRETFNGIIADEINEANGGAVCRMTANDQLEPPKVGSKRQFGL